MKAWLTDKLKQILADLRKAWKSVTIWLNALVITATALMIEFLPELIEFLPEIKEYMTAETFIKVSLVLSVLNFLVRFRTTKALRDK